MDASTKKRALGAISGLLVLTSAVVNVKMANAALDEADEKWAELNSQVEKFLEELKMEFNRRYPEK